ncbi:MAG TPA: hypothetical protein VL588_12020, partial [Bdellovibrionota bacterium]|nr:hypothetical protein [Bdellovibrionota bacterium]
LSAWWAIQEGGFWMGLLTLGLCAYWYVWITWARRELGAAYINPGLRWYVGRPKPLPGLVCRLDLSEGKRDLQVARLDAEGVFIFGLPTLKKPPAGLLGLELAYRGRQVSCQAEPVGYLPDRQGMGLRFCENSADTRKELGDFVERLKGEGHVL